MYLEKQKRKRMTSPGNQSGTDRLLGNVRQVTGYWGKSYNSNPGPRRRLQKSVEMCLLENALIKPFLPRCDQTIKLNLGFPNA